MYGVAAMNTGRNFIGIEKDTHYFEVAKKRVGTEVAKKRVGTAAKSSRGQ